MPSSIAIALRIIVLFVVICFAFLARVPAYAGDPIPPPTPIPGDKVLFLTFDDGPFTPGTQEILDALAEYDVRATFFIVGRQAVGDAETLRMIYDAGHGLGNHGFNHANLQGVGWEYFEAEVMDAHDALGDLDSMCLRPPYGAYDDTTIEWASELGYDLVRWTVDPQDWRLPGARAIAEHVISHALPNAIVLLHDGGGDRSQTAEALRILLPRLKADGWQFKALCRDVLWADVLPTPMPTEWQPAPQLEYAEAPSTVTPTETPAVAPIAEAGARPTATPMPSGSRTLPQGGAATPVPIPIVRWPSMPQGNLPLTAANAPAATRTSTATPTSTTAGASSSTGSGSATGTSLPALTPLPMEAEPLPSELPPTPEPLYGAIVEPAFGAQVHGEVTIMGFAAHPDFLKYQLDVVDMAGDAASLAVSETPLADVGEMGQWDTRSFANGVYLLRLRVVHAGANYDEYFQHITVNN